jgi:hypothetical protein
MLLKIVIGSSSIAISTSKIRKFMALRKICSENGNGADRFGPNPHSNGDLFSRSLMFFLDSRDVNTMTAVVITAVLLLVNINFFIGSRVY